MTSYFTDAELSCRCCGELKLASGFLNALNDLREACGHPLVVNSGCRCPRHNEAEGGRKGSYHLTTRPWACCAVDISTAGWPGHKKWAFVHLAMSRGFSVGVARTFLHIDRRHIHDKDWPKPVLFNY